MRSRSYGSVKVTYFDAEAVWAALRDAAQSLAHEHPEVRRIAVFGSLVRGEAVPGSDVDLLVVSSDTNLPFIERAARYAPAGLPVGADVFVYTAEEIEAMLAEGNGFIRRALDEAVTLFQRPDQRPAA